MDNCYCPNCKGKRVHTDKPIALPFGKDWIQIPVKGAKDSTIRVKTIHVKREG